MNNNYNLQGNEQGLLSFCPPGAKEEGGKMRDSGMRLNSYKVLEH